MKSALSLSFSMARRADSGAIEILERPSRFPEAIGEILQQSEATSLLLRHWWAAERDQSAETFGLSLPACFPDPLGETPSWRFGAGRGSGEWDFSLASEW